MRILNLLSHSATLLALQQSVIIWFMYDFFLARDSTTADKLHRDNIGRSSRAEEAISQINHLAKQVEDRYKCDDLIFKTPTFDKIMLVVIDAFGSDFMAFHESSTRGQQKVSRMPFIKKSLAQHKASGFVAKAATPTVTMPRIKALVSGTIPSFMDLVYNLASDVSDFPEDNLLKLAKSRKRSIVFYGDDTWISLFGKSMFKRSKETLSLYASDFTSVDTNVTEMAIPETTRRPIDWDFLILHYLGLDHLGHILGTNKSPLIDKKLAEMDSNIEKMYSNLETADSNILMIICGDHGMSRDGNHGGGSPLESETTVLFFPIIRGNLSQLFRKPGDDQIAQIDLAVTIALLSGLPIPSMSRGVIIESLLRNLWHNDLSRMTCACVINLKQLSLLLPDDQFSQPGGIGLRVIELFDRMAANNSKDNHQSFISRSLDESRSIQAYLVRAIACRNTGHLAAVFMAIVMLLSVINIRRACNRLLVPLMTVNERVTCLGAIIVPIVMLNSTEFIEMEHFFWPLYSIAIFALFCLIAIQNHSAQAIMRDLDWLRVVLFVITYLISATWNHVLPASQNNLGWTLPVVSILLMCNFTRQISKLNGKHSLIFFALGALVLVTKIVEETIRNNLFVVHLQRLALLTSTLVNLSNVYISSQRDGLEPTSIVQRLATGWMWWIFLLSRSRNYIFIVSNVIMEASLNSLSNSFQFNPIVRAIMYLQFASSSFYGQGNTNLFTSLDIKPAFYGQSNYNLSLALPLMVCSTFGCQIYWYTKLFQRVQGEKEQERMSIRPKPLIPTNASKMIPEGTKDGIKDFIDMRNFLTISYYAFVCMVLRDHLFIWSVLSPKLVYLFMTTITLRLATSTIAYAPSLVVRVIESRPGSIGSKYVELSR